jgi:uncharacterized protein
MQVPMSAMTTDATPTIRIEVIEAWARRYRSQRLELAAGATIGEALDAAGIPRDAYPAVAIYGEKATLTQPLEDGDRIELLRPLTADPKDARRKRAAR